MAADRLGGCVGGEFTKPPGFRAITLGVMFVLVQLCTSLFAPRRCSLSVTIKRRDKGKARQSLTTKKPGSGLPGRAIVIEAGLKAGTIPIRDTKPEPSGGMGDKGGPQQEEGARRLPRKPSVKAASVSKGIVRHQQLRHAADRLEDSDVSPDPIAERL